MSCICAQVCVWRGKTGIWRTDHCRMSQCHPPGNTTHSSMCSVEVERGCRVLYGQVQPSSSSCEYRWCFALNLPAPHGSKDYFFFFRFSRFSSLTSCKKEQCSSILSCDSANSLCICTILPSESLPWLSSLAIFGFLRSLCCCYATNRHQQFAWPFSSDDTKMQELVPAIVGDVTIRNQPSPPCLPLASGIASSELLYAVWHWEVCKTWILTKPGCKCHEVVLTCWKHKTPQGLKIRAWTKICVTSPYTQPKVRRPHKKKKNKIFGTVDG